MNRRPSRLLLFALAVLAAGLPGATPPPAVPPPIPITRQIEVLLKNRLRPEPLPLDLPNPFAMPGSGRAELAATPSGEPAAATTVERTDPNSTARTATDAEILAGCTAHLRIRGLIKLKDQVQLVINDVPRKEGDAILASWDNNRVLIAVVKILPDQVTLRYNDAQLTLKF